MPRCASDLYLSDLSFYIVTNDAAISLRLLTSAIFKSRWRKPAPARTVATTQTRAPQMGRAGLAVRGYTGSGRTAPSTPATGPKPMVLRRSIACRRAAPIDGPTALARTKPWFCVKVTAARSLPDSRYLAAASASAAFSASSLSLSTRANSHFLSPSRASLITS